MDYLNLWRQIDIQLLTVHVWKLERRKIVFYSTYYYFKALKPHNLLQQLASD